MSKREQQGFIRAMQAAVKQQQSTAKDAVWVTQCLNTTQSILHVRD
jgi:hypothetical protein